MLTATPGAIAAAAVRLPGAIPIVALTSALVIVAVRRAFRLSIEASRESVNISNYWRTYSFEWSDVRAVRVGVEVMGVIPIPAFLFTLRTGKTVRAQATPQREEGQRAAMVALAAIAPREVEFDI